MELCMFQPTQHNVYINQCHFGEYSVNTLKNRKSHQIDGYILYVLAISLMLIQSTSLTADEENCLLCHKLKGLGEYETVDKNIRKRRILYINEEAYKYSYHGSLKCKDCHADIKQIPHKNVSRVNCAKACHIKDPSSDSWYSHKKMQQELQQSAHGGSRKQNIDLPDCKYCHQNKTYFANSDVSDQFSKFINICLQCHESKEWVGRFFRHINYRVGIRRSSKEIVFLCMTCHADPEMMGRHDLDVIVGFKDTFHGKAIKYGDEEVANCLNCHAPYQKGFSPHSIISKDNSASPVNEKNKINTCRQSGCHVDAKMEFASNGKVHPSSYGMVTWVRSKRSVTNIDQETDFQKLVVYVINLFYKLLIAVVVGGLLLHQILSLIALRRESRKGV